MITINCSNSPAKGEPSEYDLPHLIMTYTALLCLAMLRDDFTKLDRPGILRFLGACQREDGRHVRLITLHSRLSEDRPLVSAHYRMVVNPIFECSTVRSSSAISWTTGQGSTSIARSTTFSGVMSGCLRIYAFIPRLDNTCLW